LSTIGDGGSLEGEIGEGEVDACSAAALAAEALLIGEPGIGDVLDPGALSGHAEVSRVAAAATLEAEVSRTTTVGSLDARLADVGVIDGHAGHASGIASESDSALGGTDGAHCGSSENVARRAGITSLRGEWGDASAVGGADKAVQARLKESLAWLTQIGHGLAAGGEGAVESVIAGSAGSERARGARTASAAASSTGAGAASRATTVGGIGNSLLGGIAGISRAEGRVAGTANS